MPGANKCQVPTEFLFDDDALWGCSKRFAENTVEFHAPKHGVIVQEYKVATKIDECHVVVPSQGKKTKYRLHYCTPKLLAFVQYLYGILVYRPYYSTR